MLEGINNLVVLENQEKMEKELGQQEEKGLEESKCIDVNDEMQEELKDEGVHFSLQITDNRRSKRRQRRWVSVRSNGVWRKDLRLRFESREAGQLIQELLQDNSAAYAMPRKLLLRAITSAYSELSSAPEVASDLASYLFREIVNESGLLAIARRKFAQIVAGCLRHVENCRVRVFGKFLGIFEESYGVEELRLYIKMLKEISLSYFFLNWGRISGFQVKNQDYDEKHFAPIKNAIEFAKAYFSNTNVDWPSLWDDVNFAGTLVDQ